MHDPRSIGNPLSSTTGGFHPQLALKGSVGWGVTIVQVSRGGVCPCPPPPFGSPGSLFTRRVKAPVGTHHGQTSTPSTGHNRSETFRNYRCRAPILPHKSKYTILAVDPLNLSFQALAHGLKGTLPYHCPWWRPGMPEGRRSIVRVGHRPPPDHRWSQHVNDVGEEDEAHDGKEHQHQNVHHGENTVRNGRRRREDSERENGHGSRCRRSAMIGTIRAFSELRSPLPPPSKTGSDRLGRFLTIFTLKKRHKFQS